MLTAFSVSQVNTALFVGAGPLGEKVTFVCKDSVFYWNLAGIPFDFLKSAKNVLEGKASKGFSYAEVGIRGNFEAKDGLIQLWVKKGEQKFSILLPSQKVEEFIESIEYYWSF